MLHNGLIFTKNIPITVYGIIKMHLQNNKKKKNTIQCVQDKWQKLKNSKIKNQQRTKSF